MADNVAQRIKNLSDEIARLDKGIENTLALSDKIFKNSKDIGDALQKSFRKGDDAAKETTAVLKELLKTITDNFGNGKELKLAIGIEKNKLRHDIAYAEDKIRKFGKENSQTYVDAIKTYEHQLAQLTNFGRTFADINKVINGDNGKQQSEISKQRVKDEKDVQKIQEQTTAALQKRIELEERLKTLKPNAKAWRETKAEIETVNKEVQNYLARMGSLGTSGARQLKAYEKAGLITNADKQQIALERQQIDLLRQRMQAEQQLNRLLLQRDNATLAGKTVSPKVADSISRLQERIDTIDKQRIGSYQNFTQVSLQRIEGMWQNHETALTNIKTQGAQSRQRILDRQTADEQKAIEQQRKLAQRYAEIESLRNQALGGKKYGELNKTELAQWQKFSTLLADVKKQMDAIESKHPGSLLKGQSLQSTDALLQQTKENIRQRDIESKRQAAAEEKKIERELVEEAKRAAKEKSDAEKQRLEIERENLRNWQAANKAATQEADRLAKAQAKARSAEAKQTFKRTDAESVSNLKRQAEIKQQIARIDHERQLRAKTNSQISAQQAEAERKSYSALQSELSKLISQQKERERLLRGTTAQASNKIGGYADRLQVQEAKRYRQELEKIGRQQEKNKRGLEGMLPTLRRLASAFGVAFSVQGLVNFGRKLVETRGEFELQQVAMRSILQNKQLADEIWDKTMQAALQSPFTAMQLTKYTKQLAAYRIETDKLFDTTKRLADVSAGLGVDMQRLILAYGQVKAANYLRASEIRQFTEAGVNILGELSTYLSKTRGEMISTAQVMDMVQKRMVTFEDVEAIFKRMTDEGGIFYNMQYVQSQTVKGQINKLHDAYDQMLNSIGKGNEGVLKDIVAALNNIVQNWRYWAAAIKSIAFGTIIASLTKLGATLTGVNVAGIAAGKGMTKLAGGVKALGVALKGNWLTLVIGAVVSLAAELYNLNKRMKDVNAEIDEQNLNLFETKERLEGYQDAIERNNKALEGSTGNEEKLKKKREENAEILAKLKNDYPQLAEGMEMQKNGVIDLTDALRKENDELERQITLNTLMKQSSIFDKSFTEDATNLSKEYINQQQQIITARAQARSLMVQLEQKGAKDSLQYNILKQIADINPDDIQKAYERLIELRHILYNDIFTYNGKSPAAGTYEPLVDYYRKYLRNLSDVSGAENKLGDEFNKLVEYVGYELEKGLESAYKEEIEKSGLSTLQWYALNVNKVQKDVNDGVVDIYRFLRESLEKNGQAQGPGMQAYWNNIVKTNYIDPYFNAWKLGMEEAEAGGWRFPMVLPTEGGMPNIFATSKKGDGTATSTPEDEGPKAKKTASKLISLIREMRAEYDKLSKSAYGYAKSEDVVRESYKQSVKEILGKAGITDYDFTTNAGMIAALGKVKEYANKLGPEAAAEVEKYIGQLKTEMTINAQVRIREDFGRQMEEAFGNYELTLDLQKLNLPSDVLSDLFNLETVDLSDLRRKVVEFYNERLAVEADPTDLIKQVEGYYKKIDDMERKQQRDRIKDYAKYLEYELSERAKIEMEYTRKSADVAANQAFTSEQKEQIQKRLKEERDKAIAKQEWEDFKSSETYIQMMEDLEHQGTNALIAMRTELERIRENAENLSPRALKEVVNALEKIDEITIRRGMPISNIRNAAAGVRSARVEAVESGLSWDQVSSRKAAKQTQADIKAQLLPMEQQFNILQSQLGAEKEIARLEQERYENGLKLGEVFGETFMTGDNEYLNEKIAENLGYIELTQENINSLIEKRKTAEGKEEQEITSQIATENTYLQQLYAENELLQKQLGYNIAIAKEALNRAATPEERASLQARINELEEELKKLREQDAAVGNLTKKYGILGDSVQDAVQKLAGWSQQAVDVFNSFKTMMTSLGVDTDTDAWDDWSTAFETIGTVASTAASMATKIASGDYIGAALDAAKGIMDIVTQWAGNNDRELERQIQKQQERIDALKDAYARLEKQIEKTWSSVSYMQTYEQQVQNIREQIDAMEAQMRAEEAKKNTDDNAVRQYQRDIQDAYDQLDELEQKSIEVFGGIGEEGYRSAAEGFVEAWKSAFLETGDGLQGLQDHFDEFLQEWFVKQATMRIAGRMLEPLFSQIDAAVDKYGAGGTDVLMQELQNVREKFGVIAPQLSEVLEELAGMWGIQGEGSLSGLAAGIQGMTEEQANILEAYWNSVRMYTANIDMNVARIAEMLGVGGPSSNPMLEQLQTIANNTAYIKQIYELLAPASVNLGQGRGFRNYSV